MRFVAVIGAAFLLTAGVPAAHATTWQGAGKGVGEGSAWDSRGGSISRSSADDDCIGPSYSNPGKGWVGASGRAPGHDDGPSRGGFGDRFGGPLGFPGGHEGGHGGAPSGGMASPVPVPAGLVLIVTAAGALGAAGLRRRRSAAA